MAECPTCHEEFPLSGGVCSAQHMIVPRLHMNGTTAADLIEQYSEAKLAVHRAIDAVCKAAPNGRDYYPLGATATGIAQDHHEQRLKALRKVESELMALLEAVVDADDEHKRLRGGRQ